MEEKNWMELWGQQSLKAEVLSANQYTEKYGLSLSEEDVKLLAAERQNVLKKERRAEFGESILPKIIYAFCDSGYVSRSNYVETLIRLQEIFFLYKNETADELTDDELLTFMREQFEDVCFGDLDYLEGTCLELFAEAVRAGYEGYRSTGGHGEFGQFDIVQRWDKELYLEALRNLF